ncbi:MAG TPA: lysophospholipid acyltransferase family protein [Caulobacteraceae bacterium]|jgi:KDO2-lipid IV(A) lauroyltransferase|nr:lysophospholipid acyltransferase family protein [Caulobacteraceae bacterium]
MASARAPFLKDLGWRAEAVAFVVFSAVLRMMPVDVASAIGGWIGRMVGPLSPAHGTAMRNLELAMPELDLSERRRIALEQWESFGRYIFEFPLSHRLTIASGRVQVVGGERFEAVAQSGRPAVFISGHLANVDIMAAAILEAGIICDITYRAANNPYVDRRMVETRRRYGVRLFAPKGVEGGRAMIEGLGAGRSVAMLNDQRYDGGSRGVFFGHEVMTNPAAARLAQRFGTTIQPLSIRRTRGARFKLTCHEPIALAAAPDRQAAIDQTVQAINAFVEARVRERPGEWWWMHKRFPPEVYRAEGG